MAATSRPPCFLPAIDKWGDCPPISETRDPFPIPPSQSRQPPSAIPPHAPRRNARTTIGVGTARPHTAPSRPPASPTFLKPVTPKPSFPSFASLLLNAFPLLPKPAFQKVDAAVLPPHNLPPAPHLTFPNPCYCSVPQITVLIGGLLFWLSRDAILRVGDGIWQFFRGWPRYWQSKQMVWDWHSKRS